MSETEGSMGDSDARPPTPTGTDRSNRAPTSSTTNMDLILEHIKGHKIEFTMVLTRLFTVLCTLSYIIAFPGPPSSRFKQAILLNAATNSLRLHQRMPPPPFSQLNRQYFVQLSREDSLHYLMFSFIFFSGYPITLALLPCCLFALFNLGVYAVSILDKLGNQEPLKLEVQRFIAKYQLSLLHTIALSEISLLPLLIIGVFTRTVSIATILIYCNFLSFRYNSPRNAHMKLLVSKLRMIGATYAARYLRR